MTTIQHTYDEGLTDTLEQQFLELVYADEDLVRAEFEAIIAAEWPTPPPARPPLRRPASRPPTPPAGHWRRVERKRPARRPRHPGIGGWVRQRSPPDRLSTCSTRPNTGQCSVPGEEVMEHRTHHRSGRFRRASRLVRASGRHA